jgi:diguanylate cyclase (GGDEF)-like protein
MGFNYNKLKDITILYCEDEFDLRDVTTDILTQYTKKVYSCENGLIGLNTFKEKKEEIDLIITDINMPELGGLDMVRQIKEINDNIPIIVTTAFSNSSYLLDAINLGIDQYVLKPIDIKKLFEKIAKSLLYHELQDLYLDNLTHIGNRNALIKEIKYKKNQLLAILDIDQFSNINELYGDEIGDKILIEFSEFIKNNLNKFDNTIYRVGDDKFALLCKEKDISISDLEEACEEFIDLLEKDGIVVDSEIIRFDITVALSTGDNTSAYTNALRALSHAKEHYIKLIKYDEYKHSLKNNYIENRKWIQKLKTGLEDGSFKAFYQAIVDSKTKEVYKYEALIRYIEKDGTVISPFHFLPIAKKAKLFSGIIKLMMNECINFIKEKNKIVSVNVSFEDIRTISTYNYIIDTLKNNPNEAKMLHFELLETEEIEDFTLAKKFISDIKSYGCKVGVDDFGAGYSNFNMLNELQVDFVKIDGSLIKEISTNENQELIVDTISQYTHKTNLSTIAEFVSSEDIFNKITELGISHAQGYYFAQPVPIEEIE